MSVGYKVFRFLVLSLLGTLVALSVMIIGSIALNQVLPFSHWIELQSVGVTETSTPRVRLARVIREPVDVDLRIVLRNNDNGENVCSSSTRTTLEADGRQLNVSLLQELLPNCTQTKLTAFGDNADWVLTVRYTINLDFGLHKRGSITSPPFKLDKFERIASN